MQKKLQLTNLSLSQNSLYDFLSKIHDCLLHKKIKGKILAFLLFLFSISGYSQLATENFEGGIPASWTLFQNNVGTSTWGISTDGYLGSNAAVVNPASENIGAGNTAEYYLVTPSVAVPANGEIRFFTKQGNVTDNGTIYQLKLSTSSQPDINGFSVVLQSWTEADLNTGSPTAYEEKVVAIPTNFPVGLNVYIAFVAVNTQTGTSASGDSWFVDNVRVIESCPNVASSDVSFSNQTLSSATLNWTHPTATSFEIQLLPVGGTPAPTGIPVTGFSYLFSSLPANTDYDVYIKSNCPNSFSSNWAGPFSFSTLQYGDTCGTPFVIPNLSIPYISTDNLNNFNTNSVVLTTPGIGCISSTSNYAYGGKAFYSYTPTTSGIVKITLTPGLDYTGLFVYEGCSNVGVSCLGAVANTTNNPRIIDLQVTAGINYIILVSSNYDSSADIPYTLRVEQSSCPSPSSTEASNILQTSANISWNNLGNYATSWEYAVQPAGTGLPTGSGIATTSNINQNVTTTLGGSSLVAGTNYEVYVRANCGSGFTNWSTPYNFVTQCTSFPTPYFEDFNTANSTTPLPCWYSLDKNNDGIVWNYQLDGEPSIYTGDSAGNNNDLFVSPQIDLSGGPKRLRFKYRVSGGNSAFSVVLSTTGVGADEFTTVLLPSANYSSPNWSYAEKIVNIPTSITGLVNIAWYVSPNTGETASRLNIDDVYVEDKPACSDPISPTAENITTSTADLSWETGDTETQWQVAIQPLNTGLPTGTGVLVNSNPYTAINLNPATRYEYYVRAYCSSTQTSNWVGPFNFTTLCTSFPTPFYESFDDADINTKKFCWSTNNANADDAEWQMGSTYPSIQSAGFFFPTSDYDDWLISPAINVTGAKALKFKYRAAFSFFAPLSRFGVEVLISTTDTNPSSFTVLSPLMEFTNTDFLEKTVYFTANGPVYIAFRVPSQFMVDPGTSILQIDDVIIENAPPCPNPSGLSASNITQNQATLSWIQGFQEQQWDIVVQTMGTGIPTGSGIHLMTNSYIPNTLSANTEYEFYVRASCGSEESEWVGPFRFRTLCAVFNTPFLETFNTDSASEDCWRILNSNNDDTTWNLDVILNPYQGDQTAAMLTARNGANNDWLISPTINVTGNQRLRYYYRAYAPYYAEDLKVKLSTNGVELNQFTTVLYESSTDPVLINNVEYKEKIINLTGITGNINIAWQIPTEEPSWTGYRGVLLYIDNVIVENIPACATPSNLLVSNLTDTTADLGWDVNGSENTWEVSVQPFGTPAPVGNANPLYLHTANTNPYPVTGLIPATKYQYYVRAICSSTLQSSWVGPFEFTTKCSFENLCEYTITLISGNSGGVGGGINLIQNGVTVQTLEFPTGPWNEIPTPTDYNVFLCTGVEFSLFWDAIGTAPGQYPDAQIIVKDASGTIVWSSPMGLGIPRTTLYTGISTCGVITCPQPTNLAVNDLSVFSWTAGGTETQWEVFIQPVGNGTLPQSGTVVNLPSYTPLATDFNSQTSGTFEYFVRAICGGGNTSFWSGPKVFVRNDAASNALKLPVNSNEVCNVSGSDITFIGATPSSEPMSCAGINGGDIWFEFDATSKIHIIEVNGFTGNFWDSSGDEPYPNITMTLYKVVSGVLQEMTCSSNNAIITMYSTELVVGDTYKVRLTLNSTIPSTRQFNVCIKTPLDLCQVNAVNYDFENPPMQDLSGITTICDQHVVTGWRTNLDTWNSIFFWDALNSMNFDPYSGGQCVQLLADPEEDWNENDPNIKGLYKEFDTSEATQMEYSFAHATRSEGNIIQLYAGPPQGPFTLVREEPAVGLQWTVHTGQYDVPAGQNVTRFIFRAKENKIGTLLDAANFIVNNKVKAEFIELACSEVSTVVEAEGIGQWSADASNPAITTINSPDIKTTTISGFNTPGDYVYHWITRYCDKTVTVTYLGIDEVAAVTSPINYCTNETAAPLTATAPNGFTLIWFTDNSPGSGSTIAPTPGTEVPGTTIYYVSAVDSEGCVGPKTPVEVVVNLDSEYCKIIPRGISPNNDGLNETFDLTGLDVTGISIFNRYGTQVYSFGGAYTTEWHGQSDSGDKLPDGTYFYNLQKSNGTTVTGWVYINR